ncbi:pentatricopeptide repeat-containing protein At1g20300, mitochondrial [Phoenix dactylifera]|uniref:Pentatricopeptide repeat-containing protein At1g20300, mitochondrial n=1 Tax=Phoenix dactylifera TaxID=42345 RepID=A0A8B7MW87_PHODC|nr:pentatricopeptide repeat-containing protein At1g20300, mitochondrial [Phoenix dactylifera]
MAFLLKSKPPSSSSILPCLIKSLSNSPSLPDFDQSPSPTAAAAAAAAPFSAAEANLLEKLHALIKDHHRANPTPDPTVAPAPDLTIPSLSSSFSLLSPSFPPSPALTCALLGRLSSLRHGVPFSQALAFFNWWLSSIPRSPSLYPAFAELIDLAGKLHHFDIAWHLLDKMRSLEIPIQKQIFMSLIRRYVRAGLPEDAAHAFGRMPDYGVDPDPPTFASLLAVLAKKRLAAEAQSLFDSFRHRFPPDVVLYTALVHAWCRAGRLDEAERVFAEMRGHGITPNVYTYTSVIDSMCRAGQIPRAHELFCQMLDAGCSPNAATFNSLMQAHVKSGRMEQALQVHNQMKQLACEPDIITYNLLIEAHCQKGQKNLHAALKVLNQMAAKGCTPNCHTFNAIFRCILSVGNVNTAHKLYNRMRELGCRPNTVTYNLLMQLFGKDKSMDMMLRMKQEMEEEGIEPNVNTYGVLISEFCGRGHWKQAYKMMREMVEEKCLKPTVPMYEALLALLRRAGQLRRHEELVEKMAERGFISRPL